MRIRVLQTPAVACIEGIRVDIFEPGRTYDVGTLLACVLVAEQWAEPLVSDVGKAADGAAERAAVSAGPVPEPPNLRREYYPPPCLSVDDFNAAFSDRYRA